MRIRKNAQFLSDAEWIRYCAAVEALKNTYPGGSSTSLYDQFVAQHLCVTNLLHSGDDSTRDGAHGGPAFLAWHREYLRRYELALETVDPRVTLPYWDWTLGAQWAQREMFTEQRLGSGALESGNVVWEVHENLRPDISDTRPTPKARLWRDLRVNSPLPNAAQVRAVLLLETFRQFRSSLEAIHGSGHGWVGGDMRYMTSPNDPVFFMHHAQVDRLWAIWQREHPGYEHYGDGEPDVTPESLTQGHRLDDYMWPWDGGAATPSGQQSGLDVAEAAKLIPTEATTDLVRPRDVLDTEALGYVYDGVDTRREFREAANQTHEWSRVEFDSSYRNPAVVACLSTFEGPDTAGVRLQHVGDGGAEFKVEEEQSRDSEVGHVPESIAWLAGEEGQIYDASGQAVGEIGRLRMGFGPKDQYEQLDLRGDYVGDPVVIATISSYNGEHPAHMRVIDTPSGPFLQLEEWAYLDKLHYCEDVSFLAVQAGHHRMRDGTTIEAGRLRINHEWTSARFDRPFDRVPVVLTQCMSVDGRDPVVTRQRAATREGFEVRLQEEEGRDGTHVLETVRYVALLRS